jgi:hypothetical protein
MPSPFPGMDPYLEAEALWPWFRHQLVVTLEGILRAPLGHTVQRTERRFQEGLHECREEYLCVRDAVGERLVTVLDVVGPAAKRTDAGREAYLATRRDALRAGASAVEIDLVLGGRPTLDYNRDGLPPWDYAVTVSRATHPERFEIYTSTVDKRLPRFKVLAAGERDLVLDLQAAFARAYDDCECAGRIDYDREPEGLWNDDVRVRVAQVLRDRLAQPGQEAPPTPV